MAYEIVWKWWAILLGVAVDIAAEVFLQQIGAAPFEMRDFLVGIGRGALIGFLAPNVGAAVGAWLANREIRALEAE